MSAGLITSGVVCNACYLDNEPKIINIDYLQIFGSSCQVYTIDEKIQVETFKGSNRQKLVRDGNFIEIHSNLYLVYTHGGRIMQNVFDVYYYGENVGVLETCPRDSQAKIKNPKACSFKLANHLLYHEDWHSIFNGVINGLGIEIQNISRLDISIDNCLNVVKFLNDYFKEKIPHVRRKGMRTGKGKGAKGGLCITTTETSEINTLFVDEKTFLIDGFRVGSPNSNKYISIYNKTNELVKSQKSYISEVWAQGGVENENVYRVELRLNSTKINEIADFDINKLTEKNYLASIFKMHIENFFQFVELCDSNISRCPEIKLIDFEKLQAYKLNKTKKVNVLDIYKAKLTIHLLYKMGYLGEIDEKEFNMYYKKTFDKFIKKFELEEWVQNNANVWRKKYKKYLDTDIIKDLFKKDRKRWKIPIKELVKMEYVYEIDYKEAVKMGFSSSFERFSELMNYYRANPYLIFN